jgi:hypothetical protein
LALLNVLPNDYLTEIRVANGELTLHFDFQNEDNRFKLKLPPSTSIVIESASEDALAVCKENVLKVIKTDARKFYLNSEVKLTLSRTGIKVC